VGDLLHEKESGQMSLPRAASWARQSQTVCQCFRTPTRYRRPGIS
jgi:hypothetical protein